MKNIYLDMTIVATFILIIFAAWTNATSLSQSKSLIIFMYTGLFLSNLYFIYSRETKKLAERSIYIFSFFIFVSMINAVLLIDDFGFASGVYYMLAASVVVSVLILIMAKWSYLKKFSLRKQNFMMWIVSLVFAVLGFLSIVY